MPRYWFQVLAIVYIPFNWAWWILILRHYHHYGLMSIGLAVLSMIAWTIQILAAGKYEFMGAADTE